MYCCSNCFSDSFLQDYIINNNIGKGKCSFCRSKKHYPLIEPSKLIDLFQPLFDLYTETDNGQMLDDLLQSDWSIFSKCMDRNKQIDMLSEINSSIDIHKKQFISELTSENTNIDKWYDFTEELKHENRFFLKNSIDTEQLSELLSYLLIPKDSNPKHVFRARINHESIKIHIDDMGKPPIAKSLDGRANPKGISYFYGASNEKTAIAETRPYKSENVCVAKFRIKRGIHLIDLRNPKNVISPFSFDDDNLTLLYKEHMPFLEHLGRTLSKPILPYNKELEYLPTQYLCELIKNYNFNGIVYKSSLEKGDNYVFFDSSFLTGLKVESFLVSETNVNSVRIKKEMKKGIDD